MSHHIRLHNSIDFSKRHANEHITRYNAPDCDEVVIGIFSVESTDVS